MRPEARVLDFYCSRGSSDSGEQLAGTASQGLVWFLLEYNLAWENKAFEASLLPEGVKAHLAAAVRATPQSRVLMIKSRPGMLEPGVRFYVAVSTENSPRLYAFNLRQITDLLKVDLARVVQGDAEYSTARMEEPLFIVCTNGKRDACCALFGLPVYEALRQAEKADGRAPVWQSSHVGGHRFAPNLVVFPEAIYYGRVQPGEAAALRERHLRGEVDLAHLRGRACYPPLVQAADALMRAETGRLGTEEFNLISAAEEKEGIWRVTFRSQVDEMNFRSLVRMVRTGEQVRTGCFTLETEEIVRFELLECIRA